MTILASDFSVDSSGNIRHTGGNTTVYPVLDLHAWLQDLADNASAAGDDAVSILSANPSKLDGPRDATIATRLNLINGFNIDDTTAKFFYKGSIKQASGNTLYAGLKTIGGIVAASPMYVVQGTAKLSPWWSNGHIQILVNVKSSGTLVPTTIAGGVSTPGYVTVYSRKWSQTYSHFDVDMSAGGENPAAMSTSLDTGIGAVALATAQAYSAYVTIAPTTPATVDIGDGVSGTYTGTITVTGGLTVQQLYQYLQAICSETSVTTIGSTLGWRFRGLGSFPENIAAPFGTYAGGKLFMAQGWYVTGLSAGDALNYQLTDNAGVTHSKPAVASITVANLLLNDYVLVGRDTGTDMLTAEYTMNGAGTGATTAAVINETIKTDTPTSGVIRIGGVPYNYSAFNSGTKTFTLTSGGTWTSGAAAWVPFIDTSSPGTTPITTPFTFNTGFNFRVRVRSGAGATPIIPFETTGTASAGAQTVNVIRTADV
jgi:hypothetical protein